MFVAYRKKPSPFFTPTLVRWSIRALLQVLAAVTALGCLVAMEFSWMPFEYTHWQYMAGVGVAFLAMQAHEGVVMSITTKVIPAELAR